jgi:ferric iron reductase protein FhuF
VRPFEDGVDAADFFGAELISAIRAHAVARGTSDHQVAASVLLQGYVRRVAEPLIDALLHDPPPPDPAIETVVVHRVDGWIDEVTLGTTTPPPPGAGGYWQWAHRRLVDDNIAVAVVAVQRVVRLGSRSLWGNAASAISSAFRSATIDHPQLDPAIVAARLEWFLAQERRTQGLCVVDLVDHGERSWLVHERRTCCLIYKIPGHRHCSSCSLLDPAERRARTVEALPDAVRAP